MLKLVAVITKVLARGLPKEWNCPSDVFDGLNYKPSAPMRLLHYRPQPKKLDNQFGGMHSESIIARCLLLTTMSQWVITLTLEMCQSCSRRRTLKVLRYVWFINTVSQCLHRYLQVWYPPTETWIPVPVKAGSYVINMGDMMQKWTAGYYRSARHRVISTTKTRFSVPFFLNGNLDMVCHSLDGSGATMTVGEHVRQRLIETIDGEAGRKLRD